MQKAIFYILLVTLPLALSCTTERDRSLNALLLQAEAVMEECPDSAYTL